jgi:hypothetical protein
LVEGSDRNRNELTRRQVSAVAVTLFVWAAPTVDHPDEAARLLEPYYERGDAGAFDSSPDIAIVSDELRRRFPDAEGGPWAEGLPPTEVDRVLRLTILRSADATVVNEIVEVAHEHSLVVYDPQGPSFYLPRRAVAAPIPPLSLGAYLKVIGMGIAAAGVFLLGWWIQVAVVKWVLMIVGAFFVTVVLFLLGVLIVRPGRR